MTRKEYVLNIHLNEEWIGDEKPPLNFYYEFINENGFIIYFSVMQPDKNLLTIDIPDKVIDSRGNYFFKGHFEGYTYSFPLK